VIQESFKFKHLLKLLGDWNEKGLTLIFVEKKEEADELFKQLFEIGYKILVLHGGLDHTD
jgi:superfamily II DNA/RNA helicase